MARTGRPRGAAATLLILALGCASGRREEAPAPRPTMDPVAVRPRGAQPADTAALRPVEPPAAEPVDRIAPPSVAYANGWLPVSSTGADRFLRTHPKSDGRGVVIAILDTGIDPSIPGLTTTPAGDPKLLDFRDFSGEGAVPLRPVTPSGDTVEVGGRRLRGFGRVAALDADGPWYAGTIAEIPLGEPPASDLNGNGAVGDTLPVVVTRATDGWVLLADTDGDGSLQGEQPVRDYLLGRQWFGWAARGKAPGIAVAANFAEAAGKPSLTLAFDLSGHGSHVAGIAAAHDLYGVSGFDGVAPGAQLLGLKISNSAQGSVSTTGAMVRAVDYAVRFAESRRLELVLNLSFGVGNEIEGKARIDQLIDSILSRHPAVVLTVSAGNDGPGLSTLGFPGSTDRAITVGATIPPAFLQRPAGGGVAEERVAYFSSRGGELAKPDLITPGVAYSSVPRWNAGDEVKQGTSMASPHAAGLAALLLSALRQDRLPVDAARIRRALMVTASPGAEGTFVDEGRGLPDVEAAYRWLTSGRPDSGVRVEVPGTAGTAAWIERRPGTKADSAVRFELVRADSAPPATYALRSDVPWLRPAARVTLSGPSTTVDVPCAAGGLAAPGAYTGTVSGWGADTLAGPAFRLVVTVVAPAPAADTVALRAGAPVGSGEVLRSFFLADSARPFEVTVAAGGARPQGLAFLHEPNGAPYREGNAAPAGREPAVFQVDARDVRPGAYEVDVATAPGHGTSATATVFHAPFTIGLSRGAPGAIARLTGVGGKVEADVRMALMGGERRDTVLARGSVERRIPFVLPGWATIVVVDVSMDRAQWGRFTDFGLTLFDSTGRQLGKDPLEYAFGRLAVDLPGGAGDRPAAVALFPGFADSTDTRPWSAIVSIRAYADSTVVLTPAGGDSSAVAIVPGATITRAFELKASPWPLGEKFFPLSVVAVRAGGRVWTREAGLPPDARSASR